MHRPLMCLLLLLTATTSVAAPHPRDADIPDTDTRAWWHATEALSGDAMQGRDTGSAGHRLAAQWVAARFAAAGLRPAGEHGSFLQAVPLHEIAVMAAGSGFTLRRPDGRTQPLKFLEQISVTPTARLPRILDAALTFRGYCTPESLTGVAGQIVVCFGTQRTGLPPAAARTANARAAGALAILHVDDPYFDIEPPRWPAAYARSVTFADAAETPGAPFASLRLSAAAFATLIEGSGEDAAAVLQAGGARAPLRNFEIPSRLQVRLAVHTRAFSSPNVLAVLPGTDPALKAQYVVLGAHLDGYGIGTPVNGDALYNGTLDDAAYVALLIQLADNLHAGRRPAPKRSLLLAAFTGEEKGLLGAYWYVAHPTVPLADTVADVNLDQLRPLFPLAILTAEALDESSLGGIAREVAGTLHIELRADREPERNLLRRADQYPFLERHVPAISFLFGYDPGTEAERRYREWYQTRYHRPQDDLGQPIDFSAAASFNTFFYRLVAAIADAPERPAILAGSAFAP